VIDENEWVHFVYNVASAAANQGYKVPPMDEEIVRQYYYAFNQVYTSHPGISMAKLNQSIDAYDRYDDQYLDVRETRQRTYKR